MREFYWVLASSIFVVSFVADVGAFAFLRRPEAQLVLGALVVLSFVMDPWAGVLLAGAALVVLQRSQQRLFGGAGAETRLESAAMVTPEGLHGMQSNVFSPLDYKKSMVGIRGVYGEGVYGAQGLDDARAGALPGFLDARGSAVSA